MSARMLDESAVRLNVEAADWREAVRAAGDALVVAGVASDAYTDEMLDAIDRLGPYIVIAPGFALAHSRPSPAVRRTGLSWVRLATPVEFGSAKNDPVRLVVGLAAVDHDEHLHVMSSLARVLANPAELTRLLDTDDPAEITAAIDPRPE